MLLPRLPALALTNGLILALSLVASPALADFHYYDGGPISTPRIAERAAPPVPQAPAAFTTPSSSFSADPTGFPVAPVATTPASGSFAPPTTTAENDVVLSGPERHKNAVERNVDRAIEWSADLAGGGSYERAGKNGLPRATMITTVDRQDAERR